MYDEHLSQWAFDWAYQHGLNGMKFEEFYQERKVHNFFTNRKIMNAWSAGLDVFTEHKKYIKQEK